MIDKRSENELGLETAIDPNVHGTITAQPNAPSYAAHNFLSLSSNLPVSFPASESPFQLPILKSDISPLPKYQSAGNAENCHKEDSVGPFEFLHLASPQESSVS